MIPVTLKKCLPKKTEDELKKITIYKLMLVWLSHFLFETPTMFLTFYWKMVEANLNVSKHFAVNI